MTATEHSGSPEYGLFDVFPWRHGATHSRALAWLLSNGTIADAILRAIPGAPWDAGARLVAPPTPEGRVGTRAADLRLAVRTAEARFAVAVETKVEDTVSDSQLVAYRDAGHAPLL